LNDHKSHSKSPEMVLFARHTLLPSELLAESRKCVLLNFSALIYSAFVEVTSLEFHLRSFASENANEKF